MLKPYGFDLPVDVADEVIAAFKKAGYHFDHALVDDAVWFAVFAHSDVEAFKIFTSALDGAGFNRVS